MSADSKDELRGLLSDGDQPPATVNASVNSAPDSKEHHDAAAVATAFQAVRLRLVLVTMLASAVWLVLATGMPFFNRVVYNSYLPDAHKHPSAALTPTLLQMLVASALLLLLCAARHWYRVRSARGFLGPRVGRKLLLLAIPGFFYAGVMATTNTSVQLTSVNLHVILRQTTIVWVVVGAFFFRGERPSVLGLVCCAGLVVGTALASWAASQGIASTEVGAIMLTLASSFLQAGMFVSMRAVFLHFGDDLNALEAVAIKMSVASLLLVPVAVGLDWTGWAALSAAPTGAKLLVCSGIVVTAAFASLQVFLQLLAGAVSIGVLNMCVIIPQVVLSLLLQASVNTDAVNIAGYVVSPLFATVYGAHRAYVTYHESK